jgi:hypothetical protein
MSNRLSFELKETKCAEKDAEDQKEQEEDDPWNVVELKDKGKPWSGKSIQSRRLFPRDLVLRNSLRELVAVHEVCCCDSLKKQKNKKEKRK